VKFLLKRAIMTLYLRGLISGATVTRAFARFDLWSA
jgi:hypothetical protein